MNIDEKIERSTSSERIDFTKITCLNQADALVRIDDSDHFVVLPVWDIPGDFEGRLYAEYIADHPEYNGVYLRSGLLERLERAAQSLNSAYQLVVRAGHRPADVQKRVLNAVKLDYLKRHPKATDSEALKHARMYVSDPAIKLPPHCCGAAIDIELRDKRTGKLVDFGSTMNDDADISHLHSDKVNEQQRANRLLLLTTMLEAGFASYYAEWWHFSYGDQIWVWFYKKDTCLYGLIEV